MFGGDVKFIKLQYIGTVVFVLLKVIVYVLCNQTFLLTILVDVGLSDIIMDSFSFRMK